MSSQTDEMSQTNEAVTVCVNIDDGPSDKIAVPVTCNEEAADSSKSDMRVVITINPTEMDGSKPDPDSATETEKEQEQAESLTGSENTDSVGSEDTGVVNQAYVEDETDQNNVKTGKKKGHQRSPSYSPNKDDESITAVGGGGSEELDAKVNPPIISDVTENNKEKQLYSEYFMPVNEYKPQLGEYKKSKKGPSAAKIFCWMLSLFLLAGAIVLAVLIGTGIIDTDPTRTVKVSRKLEPETLTNDPSATVDLIEVKNTDLPNVRTNLPAFFTSKTTHFNGEMRLDLDWNSDLADKNSYQFQQLARMLEDGINELLRNQFENFTFHTTVTQFSEGSVIVVFKINVSAKLETDHFLDKTDIANALINNINQEYGFLFGKFSAPNNSVIIQEGSQELRKQDEEQHDKHTETNMQPFVTMRITTEDTLTTKHSKPSSNEIMDIKSTTISQNIEDWENIKNMEISAESKIDSFKEEEEEEEEEDMEVDTELIPQELFETGTESVEIVTDLSSEFKSFELESELGSGEVEDATELALELN